MTYVCPFCQHSIPPGQPPMDCPGCHMPFDPGEWPQEAYSPRGMHPVLKLAFGNGREFEPQFDTFQIGLAPDGENGLTLDGINVAKIHAEVFRSNVDGAWRIRKKSTQDLLLNGVPVTEYELLPGSEITIGTHSLRVSISYAQDSPEPCAPGTLRTDPVIPLDRDRIHIGSDPRSCNVVIEGAAPCHALLYKRAADDSWYLADCASASGVKINGVRIRNRKLLCLDTITIAGLDFVFDGSRLSFGKNEEKGLSLTLRHASARVGKNAGEAKPADILHDLNFTISPGEFVGVLGPSGCGKSSLIQRVAGLAEFTSGEMLVNGVACRTLPDECRNAIAYLPQQNILHNDLTLEEEFSCCRTLHAQQGRPVGEEDVLTTLRVVGLEQKLQEPASRLSGGQQRRAGIALALLRKPRMLILDEPTSGLDPATEKEIMDYLKRISKQNRTVICSTHGINNLKDFDKVLVLSQGRMIFFGTPGELFDCFRITQALDLYQMLAAGESVHQKEHAEEFSRKYSESALAAKYMQPAKASGLPPCEKPLFTKQVLGYWKRMLFETFSFTTGGSWWKKVWLSGFFIQTVLQPLLVALVLKMACASHLLTQNGQKEVLFFAAIAAFWLGLNNSVRELVKERVPWRCLERLERISVGAYLTAKITWTSFFGIVRTLVFSLFLFTGIIPRFPVINIKGGTAGSIPLELSIVAVLALVCITGSWIGLAVSAVFKSENAAVSLLPIIVIPVLFFSQPIMQNSDFSNSVFFRNGRTEEPGSYTKSAYYIERIMPCNSPEILMNRITRKLSRENVTDGEIRNAWRETLLILGLHMAFALVITCTFQIKNEKDWEGR